MRYRIIAVVAAFSLLFTVGVAAASTDDADSRDDTRFSFGYDPQAQLFFYKTQNLETSSFDCAFDGTLTATYEAGGDGGASITGLTDGQDEVTFNPTDDESEEGAEPPEAVTYNHAIDECGISGIPVGARGHINHGQFMKLFNEVIDMQGHGCLNRWLAKSNLGKDDQQVKTQDFAEATIGEGGTIDFTTALADCEHGKKDKGEDHPGRGHHKDETSATDDDDDRSHGRPDSPGNSGKAKDKKKDK